MRLVRRPLAGSVVVTLAAGLTVLAAAPQAADAATVHTRSSVVAAAGAYARQHGYTAGIAVYDTKTGALVGSNADSTFASESVVKTMIATRILLQGRMHGSTAQRAYKMITQSDDAIASSLYGGVGGDGLITWIKGHYKIPSLGSPPRRAGWWGATRITAAGLVRFYAKVKQDKKVGPWLLNAMHHATTHGSDGFYQFFGLKQATKSAAIKQGWGFDYPGGGASENTTGFVGPSDRYAVAVLARGKSSTYGSRIGGALSSMARLLLPGGSFPAPIPRVTSLDSAYGATSGGQTVWVHGQDFSGVTAVAFGGTRSTRFHVLNPTTLWAAAPSHASQTVTVHVVTSHGMNTSGARYRYAPGPSVTGLSVHVGPQSGGTRVEVAGNNLGDIRAVWFGGVKGTDFRTISTHAVRVTAPPHAAGSVDVEIQTLYGRSRPAGAAGRFSYGSAPVVTGLSPASGPAAGGTAVTVTGSGFDASTTVTVDGVAVPVTVGSSTTLQLTAPAHAPGAVPVRVSTSFGSAQPTTYTYTG